MKQFNLSIPTPCHESWEQMTPTEKGRFCASCQKQVIDFTTMSDQQLAAYFKKSPGNTCGRFMADQLERDIVIPTKRIPWLRYFFQFTLPAFLLSLKATAQKIERVEKVSTIKLLGDTLIDKTKPEPTAVKSIGGRVKDESGNPVPFATVMEKGTNRGISCDAEGKFSLAYSHEKPFILHISAVGYSAKEYHVNDTSNNEIVLSHAIIGNLGVVVVAGGISVRPKKEKKPFSLINNTKRDTAFNQFSVYPNPARSNGTITIDCKKMNKGEYTLQLMAVSGTSVCMKPLVLEEKGGLLRTDLPTLVPGQYIITLQHKKSNRVYTEKIQVL